MTSSTKRSITIKGHRTSITLEDAFWESLKEIAETRNLSVSALIAEVDKAQPGNLSGALRVFALEFYRKKG